MNLAKRIASLKSELERDDEQHVILSIGYVETTLEEHCGQVVRRERLLEAEYPAPRHWSEVHALPGGRRKLQVLWPTRIGGAGDDE